MEHEIAFDITQQTKSFDLIYETGKQIPASVHYTIKRYIKPQSWTAEDVGIIKYEYKASDPEKNCLELRFCISGNTYCNKYQKNCNKCKAHNSLNCIEKLEIVDILTFRYTPTHLSQFVKSRLDNVNFSEEVLTFNYTSSFTKVISLCSRARTILDGLLNHDFTDTLENIYINAQTQMLLLYSLDCMLGEKLDTVSCKFLANDEDKEKIIKAREILIRHIGEPITIKELSRKVATNECYLKKGFKEMFGTTIFDFYQSQRMEHAKYLLYEKGLSVTEVSDLLGYSSISHFSTAFKKHTGLKPCELLFRQ
ncbi:MAG: helix-turn-helix transcriptional regulator [Chitinophagaceae bacterium]|nr:helix-turn-helix transcriptional regulator [Chitinophagaceae bacterium]